MQVIQLTFVQVAVIGVVASALVAVLRLIYEVAAQRKFTVPDWFMIVLVYIASFALAIWFFPQTMPIWPGVAGDAPTVVIAVLGYVSSFLVVLTIYAAAASVIYLVLLQKVKDGLGQAVAPRVYPPQPLNIKGPQPK